MSNILILQFIKLSSYLNFLGSNAIVYYVCWLSIITGYFHRHFKSFDCELILCESVVQPEFSVLGSCIGWNNFYILFLNWVFLKHVVSVKLTPKYA